jgi:hypothetical protein
MTGETAKVREAVELAKRVAELKYELKQRERDMSLEEFIAYVSETRTISDKYRGASISGNDKPEPQDEKVLVGKKHDRQTNRT